MSWGVMSADGEWKVRSSALDRTVLLVAALGLFLCTAVLQASPAAAEPLGPGVVGTTVAATTTTTLPNGDALNQAGSAITTDPSPSSSTTESTTESTTVTTTVGTTSSTTTPTTSTTLLQTSKTTSNTTLPPGPSPETLQRLRDLEALSGKISAKQYQIYKASIELDEVDRVLGLTVEEYNLRVLQLEDAERESERLRHELELVRAELATALAALEERMVGTYKSDTAALGFLLGTTDLSDFIRRLSLLVSIVRSDRDRFEQISSLRARSDRLLDEVSRQIYDVATAARRLEEQKAQIQTRLDERQSYIDLLSAEVRALVDEQRRLAVDVTPLGFDVGAFMVGDTNAIVKTALQYLGIPYVWGGATPSGFDCSGLVQYVFKQHGISVPHYSRYQAQLGFEVPTADIRPADLVFFGDPVYHEGMYIGDGLFIHAPRTGDVVKISVLASRSDLSHVRRVAVVAPVEGPPQGP